MHHQLLAGQCEAVAQHFYSCRPHLRRCRQSLDGALQPQQLRAQAVHVAEQRLTLVAVDVRLAPRQLRCELHILRCRPNSSASHGSHPITNPHWTRQVWTWPGNEAGRLLQCDRSMRLQGETGAQRSTILRGMLLHKGKQRFRAGGPWRRGSPAWRLTSGLFSMRARRMRASSLSSTMMASFSPLAKLNSSASFTDFCGAHVNCFQ
jgi:hypothetical protein